MPWFTSLYTFYVFVYITTRPSACLSAHYYNRPWYTPFMPCYTPLHTLHTLIHTPCLGTHHYILYTAWCTPFMPWYTPYMLRNIPLHTTCLHTQLIGWYTPLHTLYEGPNTIRAQATTSSKNVFLHHWIEQVETWRSTLSEGFNFK